jgi:CRP-like cAMP-binding protein
LSADLLRVPAVPSISSNRLLSALPSKDREQLFSRCDPVELSFTEMLYRAGEPIPHVYLPTNSLIALMAPINDSSSLEVGLIGNEGMLGTTLMLGVDVAPFNAQVQKSGYALRITRTAFLDELEQSPVLQARLKRYLYVSMSQLAQTAICNRFHLLEARLARWLLMNQDRAHADTFHITHVSMASMLGVRRVGITKAANSLQMQKLIRYHRGKITVLDRVGLEAASCGCYKADREIYRRILEPEGLPSIS